MTAHADHSSRRAKDGSHLRMTNVLCGIQLRQPSQRLALEPGVDALDHLAVVVAKTLFGDVAEMRRQHDVVELAERMIDRQRFDREYIDRSACDLPLLQGLQQSG